MRMASTILLAGCTNANFQYVTSPAETIGTSPKAEWQLCALSLTAQRAHRWATFLPISHRMGSVADNMYELSETIELKSEKQFVFHFSALVGRCHASERLLLPATHSDQSHCHLNLHALPTLGTLTELLCVFVCVCVYVGGWKWKTIPMGYSMLR